jgi:hypothetical protein
MRSQSLDTKAARAVRKFAQFVVRLEADQARQRVRDKRNEATRHYRLGLMLESFLFSEPTLLARIEELIRQESTRVRAAFALDRPPSWFEQPQRDDPKKVVDTRRFWLGIVLERMLPGNDALSARVEGLLREQAPHVRAAFGMGGVPAIITTRHLARRRTQVAQPYLNSTSPGTGRTNT